MAALPSNQFDLFVTCVDKVGPMLKIWGQTDRLSSMFLEQLLKTTSVQFEAEPNSPHLSKLIMGLLCCAKYGDGHYYRAQITNLRQLIFGSVEVKFIDYGNVEVIPIENIRLLENVPIGLSTMKPQAMDFILANVIHVNQQWDEKTLSFIHNEISYMELKSSLLGAVNNFRFIKVLFHDTDLSEYLIQRGIAAPIPLASQENIVKGVKINQNHQFAVLANKPSEVQLQNQQQPLSPVATTPEFCSYKTLPLEPNSEHLVYVSYVEDGPYLFSIQLKSMEVALEKLMVEINQITNLLPLTESPLPGYPCMARCLEDNSLCRAVVINLVEGKCKIYYVDFGNTDILPFSNIFQIPFKYMLPKVMSMRFTLAGLKAINVTNDMKCAFKEFVTNRLLKLKVLKLEGSPVLQYCELYEDNENVIEVLYESGTQYKTLQIGKGMKCNVIVSFIEGCKKFFVQLKDCSTSLNNLMMTLANTCEMSPQLQNLKAGLPCVAFYSADNQWYRSQIISFTETEATVKYVDYGNEGIVPHTCLKIIKPELVKILPAQAIECCLYGYQNMSFNNEIECVFESLTLECEFTMKVMGKQSNDTTLLVDLFDSVGNNVAALLIEKLASQKSQINSLPASKIAGSIISNEEMSSNTDNQFTEVRSPKEESSKLLWRNSAGDKAEKYSAPEKKNSRNEEKTSWRNTDDSPPKNRNQSNWNGDSPTNRRSQRNERFSERSFSRSNSHSTEPREESKFNNKRSFQNDSGKGNSNWNNSGSESEKSWSGNSTGKGSAKGGGFKKDFRQPRRNDFPKKNDFFKSNDFSKPNDSNKRKFELPPQNLASLEEPFKQLEIIPAANESVNISWFYNPENFFVQLVSNQKEFRDLMCDIQSAYNGRPPVNTEISVGASVIAEFQDDTILYRATIIENKYPKYKVQYVDFGNMSLVDCRKIWQVETRFMETPIQAIKCGIDNIKPVEENWQVSDVIDNIFNKDSFTCVFNNLVEDKYLIQLFDNDVDIRQQLIDSGVAIDPQSAAEMVDEPVDLNLLVGQNIRVEISHIQGLNKFYIHLQKEKAALVAESIQTYMKTADISTLQKLSEDQIIVGAACLVPSKEESWYRGVITNNSDSSSIQVEYPDIGGSGCYSGEEIYCLPQELCAYWYQSFECSLHNLTDDVNKLISDENFKETYEGQELIIYVDEIMNGRLIVTLYDTLGKKLDLIDPDEGAYPSIEPVCPMPILNSTLSVYVSHVDNVNSLYLQHDYDSNKIAALLESLFEFYEAIEEDKQTEFDQGDYCCAKSQNDGNWYRSRVKEINDETVEVLYIDYGNSETLPKSNLRVLIQSFYTHELALNAGLNLKEISSDLTNKIIELTADKLFTGNIVYGESGWIVNLMDGETNITQTLIDLNLAASFEEPCENVQEIILEETETQQITNELVTTDETKTQVVITHIDSPSEFYVQLTANEEAIYALQANLQEKVAELPDLEGADIGVLCAAKYTVDEQWYRAEVLDADSEITTVRFVDYGNTDVITNNQGSIKTLPADLLAIDKYARKCSLNIIPNKDEEWTQEGSEIFENAVNSDEVYANIVYQDEKNKTFVELFVNGNNVAEQLLNANLAVPITRDEEDNVANNTGFVSHLNSISEFWIQLESSVPDLEMIVDRLASADTFADLQDLSPGILCAANFPDDEMWYRARILSNTVAGIEVLFVDYGNSSTAMKLKVLPEDLVQMPILAQKCSLSKPSNIVDWSDEANEKFREISEDGATIFTIKKIAAGETSTVELFINGNNIMDQLIELCVNEEQKIAVEEPEYTQVHITYVESPNHFWVQLSSDSEKIDEMSETLASAGSYKKLTNWDADTICAALYLESGLWYRAKIFEAAEEYEVLLVDYGNTICTNELRALPEAIASIPPLATLCSLEFPENVTDWTEANSAKFANLLADNCKEYRIEFLDNEVPSTVRLYINGKSVTEDICAETSETVLESTSSASLISDKFSLLAVNTQLPEPSSISNDEIEEIQEIEDPAEIPVIDKDEFQEEKAIENISTVSETNLTEPSVNTQLPEPSSISNDEIEEIQEIEDPAEIPVIDKDEIQEEKAIENISTASETNLTEPSVNTQLPEPSSISNDEIEEIQEIEDPAEIPVTDKDEMQEVKAVENISTVSETNLTEPSVNINDQIEKIENLETTTEISIMDESYLTAKDEHEEIFNLDDSNSTVKEASFIEEPVESTEISINQDINKSIVEEDICNVNETCERKQEQLENSQLARSNTPHSERIVPGSVCGGETEPISIDLIEHDAIESVEEPKFNINEENFRPATPRCDKIVPGSISRGDLQEPAEISDDEIYEENEMKMEPVTVISRPITPFSEKIVPGSISRGEFEKIPLNYINDNVSRPATPISEKIVPGSICRGDLEEPPQSENMLVKEEGLKNGVIPETVILNDTLRPCTPKTPVEEKIVPGSINKGANLQDDITTLT